MHNAKAIAALLAVSSTLAACQQPQNASPASSADKPETAVTAPATVAVAATADADARPGTQGEGLSKIVALDSIGATKEFLERTLGQSTYETPEHARYTMGNCDVELWLGKDKGVESVSIGLKKGCRFDASGLTGSEKPVLIDGPMTFAQFESRFGAARYSAPCLRLCGNAFDPYVDAVVVGSRVNGVIDIAAQAVFVEDAVIDAAKAWEQTLTAKAGEDYVAERRFNCEGKHDDLARTAFAQIPVQSLQFGRDLGTSECG